MAKRQRICQVCGNQFEYVVSRGADRIVCSDQCGLVRKRANRDAALSTSPMCKVDGCTKHARSAISELCEAHYYRMRRNGILMLMAETSPPPKEKAHIGGYVLEFAPNHYEAMRTGNNRVYQHRRVFYDHNGSGPFRCHWCQKDVMWDTMHVDHVNAIRNDNSPGNLVASCPSCNQSRGHSKGKATSRARSPLQLTWRGETKCIADWADAIGIHRASLQWRIKAGWTVDKAMAEPRGKTGPKDARH